jgi:hypothetical protein
MDFFVPDASTVSSPEESSHAAESEDQAGGHDPEGVAGPASPRPIHVTRMPQEKTAVAGSIRDLVAQKKDVDLSGTHLTPEQVRIALQILLKSEFIMNRWMRCASV